MQTTTASTDLTTVMRSVHDFKDEQSLRNALNLLPQSVYTGTEQFVENVQDSSRRMPIRSLGKPADYINHTSDNAPFGGFPCSASIGLRSLTDIRPLVRVQNNSSSSSSDNSSSDAPQKTITNECTRESGTSLSNNASNASLVSIEAENSVAEKTDWKVPINVQDIDVYVQQTINHEVERLSNLKSYYCGGVREGKQDCLESFDRLSTMTARLLDAPVTVITLVDLGKIVILGRHGIDLQQLPRKQGFASHCVIAKDDVFLLPDATKDARFRDDPKVTGPMHLRFYCGYPLVSPEGYKIGTVCVLDTKPRHNFTEVDKEKLSSISKIAMDYLIRYRDDFLRSKASTMCNTSCSCNCSSPSTLALVSHNLVTPLTGVELSLSLLKEDTGFVDFTTQQRECINTATKCANEMSRMCETLRAAQEGSEPARTSKLVSSSHEDAIISMDRASRCWCTGSHHDATDDKSTTSTLSVHSIKDKTLIENSGKASAADNHKDQGIDTQSFVEKLKTTVQSMPTHASITVSVGPNLPLRIQVDQDAFLSAVFSALNYVVMSNANKHVQVYMWYRSEADKSEQGELVLQIGEQSILLSSLDECKTKARDACESGTTEGFNPASIWESSCMNDIDSKVQELGGSYCIGHDPDTAMHQDLTIQDACIYLKIPVLVTRQCCPCKARPLSPRSAKKRVKEIETEMDELCPDGKKRKRDQCCTNRALIVDDSLVVRKSLSRALSRLGYDTEYAVNGVEGLERMKSSVYDCVFLDFMMPAMDGMDCVRIYREWEVKHRPGYKQYIVGISAHTSVKDVERGLALGMDAFQAKPLTYVYLQSITSQVEQFLELRTVEGGEGGGCKRCALTQQYKCRPATTSSGNDTDTLPPSYAKVCLMVCNDDALYKSVSMLLSSYSNDWTVKLASTEESALQLLRQRNWPIVLLDEGLSASHAILDQFLQWEQENRVCRQRNICMLSLDSQPLQEGAAMYIAIDKEMLSEQLGNVVEEATRCMDKLTENLVTR